MTGADFSSSVAFAQVLFWLLLPVVLFGRMKWAVVAWFLMGNLDASGGEFEATSALGVINAIKAIVLPGFLIWRLRDQKGSYLLGTSWARVWITFIAWVGIASLWSPFPVAAAKAVAYLVGLMLGLILFERAGRAGLLDARFLVVAIGGTLLLGLVQHLGFQGLGFGYEVTGTRFTAFIGAQGYAAGLVALFCALLWIKPLPPYARVAWAAALLTALFFNGSRTWVLGAAFAIIISSVVAFGRRPIVVLMISVAVPTTFLLGTIAFGPSSLVEGDHAAGRLSAAVRAVSGTERGLGSIQNVAYRYRIWDGFISEFRNAETKEVLFGHGTSSAAEVGIKAAPYFFATKSLDANRVAHNEWLRAIHEWGILGLTLWSASFLLLAVGTIRIYIRTRAAKLLPLLSFLPALAIATLTENVAVGAGTATVMGLLVLVGLAFQKETTPGVVGGHGTHHGQP